MEERGSASLGFGGRGNSGSSRFLLSSRFAEPLSFGEDFAIEFLQVNDRGGYGGLRCADCSADGVLTKRSANTGKRAQQWGTT